MHRVALLPPDMAALRWSEIEPLLRKATARTDGGFEPVDVLVLVLRGEQSIWCAFDEADAITAVAVLQIHQTPRKRFCDIPFVAGKTGALADWLAPMQAAIEEYARQFGCSSLSAAGRFGWRDELAKLGWQAKTISFVRPL